MQPRRGLVPDRPNRLGGKHECAVTAPTGVGVADTGSRPRPRPRLRLYHLTHTRSYIDRTEFQYLTYPLPVCRPLVGIATETALCGYCGSEMEIRVYSSARTLRAMVRWSVMCVCGLLLLAAAVVVVVSLPDDPAQLPHDDLVTGVLIATILLGFVATVGGAAGWWHETGVRVVRTIDQEQRGRHSVRPDRTRRPRTPDR